MSQYFRDFADADGISDFTEVQTTSGHTAPSWSIVNTNELQATSASSHNEALVWNDIDSDADRDDVEIYGEIYVDSTATTQRWYLLRCSTSGGSRTGYALRVRSNSIDIYRFSGSTFTSILGVTISKSGWCEVIFRANGTDLKAKIWDSGGSEPAWDVETTDSNYSTAGHVGLFKGANTNTQLWRKLGIGTGGDAAPKSAPGGGSNVDLAGTSAAVATATAALDLLKPLAAAAAGQADATGGLSLAVPLAGAAVSIASGSGALAGGSSVDLAGSASGSASATGALSLEVVLQAAAIAQSTAGGGLTVGGTLAAAAVAQASASGSIALSIALAGSALSQATAGASFQGIVSLSGDAAAQAGAAGVLQLSVPLSGQALATAAAAGGLVVTVLLAGAAVAQASATGGLSVPVSLAGAASGHASAAGTLTVLGLAVFTRPPQPARIAGKPRQAALQLHRASTDIGNILRG